MIGRHNPIQNRLLASLPAEERGRLFQNLEFIPMLLDQSLYDSDTHIGHVYFPTTAIVSLLYEMEDGAFAEVAAVGHEGVVGISLFMGGETTPSRAVVQSAGHGYRLKGKLLKSEFHRAGPMQHQLLHYTLAMLEEIAQTLVCNRHHSLEQQFCRWMLLRLDRSSSNNVLITQEQIANLLGVRRGGISEVVGKFRKEGLIKPERGRIAVLDRAGLEARSCECYAAIKERFGRLFPRAIYEASHS